MTIETAVDTNSLDELGTFLDVNLLNYVEYECPDEVKEWKWIEDNARWKHVGNGVEGSIWEFMVYVDSFVHDMDLIPQLLRPFFTKAQESKCTWIMFNQG